MSIQSAQLHLFGFLFAIALGRWSEARGRSDRQEARDLGVHSGVAPFSLMLPYADAAWTSVLVFVIGLTIASAFSAILVFAQDCCPTSGNCSGLFFGLAFGVAASGRHSSASSPMCAA